MRIKTAAKINLALDVTGRLPDGYHLIESVFQSVGI
jgi:4-diphosphocytidyl-2-C-methyl-D-erythritol kinase